MKIITIFDEEHLDYCSYGRPDGPDDYCKECDCNEELEEIRQNIGKFAALGEEAKQISSKYYGDFEDICSKMHTVSKELKSYKDIIVKDHPDWIELFDALDEQFKDK